MTKPHVLIRVIKLKKWLIPVLYFVFGMIVYFVEDFGLGMVNEASMTLRKSLNTFNMILFITIPIFAVTLMYRKGEISFNGKDVIYTFFILCTFVVISVFWIITISWK